MPEQETTVWPRFTAEVMFGGTQSWDEWQGYWRSLTDEQRQAIKDKAKWEGRTVMAVAREWGEP